MELKTCNKCDTPKPISDFYLINKRNTRGACKKCIIKQKSARVRVVQDWLSDYKKVGVCKKCGYSKETHNSFTHKALTFHHARDNKSFTIADAAGRGKTIAKIKAEIDKCVMLCSRCHAEVHHNET